MSFDFSGADLEGRAVGHEGSRPVTRTGLKRARAAVGVFDRPVARVMRRMCRVPVEEEVRHVLGHLTGARRDRVREQKRNAWDESKHAPKVALLTEGANRGAGVSY